MMLKLMVLVKKAEWRNWTVPKMFSETAARMPDKVMIHFEGRPWTFKDMDEYSNRVANVFLADGFGKGDVVAVFMENRPEFVATW